MKNYVLALDQGTSSSRAVVFDYEGREVASASQELRQHYPRPGWVEQDPREILESQIATARKAIGRARLSVQDIGAIGIANQRETTIVWDRASGRPLYNAVVWQDRRTAPLCDELKSRGLADRVQWETGLLIDPYFSATKTRWILDHIEGARNAAAAGNLAFGTVDSWLIWNLTGGQRHVTDRSNASRTMLYSLRSESWHDGLLRDLDIPSSVLPEVLPSAASFGETRADIFGAPLPIRGVAGDQQAALFGQTCTRPGEAKNTYGTGSFALMFTGERCVESRRGLISTAAADGNGGRGFAIEGSIFTTGSAVKWLRDGLGIIKTAADVETLAGSVLDSDGVFVVPAFAGLGAPHWDPYARGAIVGLSGGSTGGHIARATLEAIALQVCDVVELMEDESGFRFGELRVDGAAAANSLLLQIQADLLGKPVVRPSYLETTALGAAYLAGISAGIWKDSDELRGRWRVDRRFEPTITGVRRKALRSGWKRAVKRALRWSNEEAG
ncbi:MAG: glycerol kinase GlpK [Dehalococcoidia bacterium]|nr:glycerol kinase GlpK [Dehalococcoidia bacterium]